MFKVAVKLGFSAAHSLRGYKGKCEDLHGHNWEVEAVFVSKKLDTKGMSIDFHEIKDWLRKVLDELDHKHLNEISYFKKVNPTSENLAKYIYDKISCQLPAASCQLKEVTVWESDNCSAAYSK